MLHGGGWATGNYTLVDPIVRALANRSGCAILSLNYRLGPENKYPAALEDVYDTIQFVVEHASVLGLDRQRIGVGGDSSGGNLAAAVTLLCRDRGGPPLSFQLLVYQLNSRLAALSALEKYHQMCGRAQTEIPKSIPHTRPNACAQHPINHIRKLLRNISSSTRSFTSVESGQIDPNQIS